MISRALLPLVAAVFLGASGATHAQPIAGGAPLRIVVTFEAGGAPDRLARAIAEKLSTRLGQPVTVDNRMGAGGNIGTDAVAKARPDGQTLLLTSVGPMAINPFVYRELSYDPARDFAPILRLAYSPNILVTTPARPFKDFGGFVQYGRQNPGKINYGSAGIGSSQHLAGELLESMAGIDMVHVPYKGGTFAVQDLVGGRLDATFSTTTAISLIQQGKLVPLAVTGSKRLGVLPAVPTIAESGFPGYEAVAWYGLVAPAGTPAAVIALLNREVGAIVKDKEFVERMAQYALDVSPSTEAEFAAFLAAERAKWSALIKRAGIKAE